MEVQSVEGDLLKQPVEAIVNPWNRNIIPWWLLLPQGVSGAIKRQAGYQPFLELGRLGPIPLGGAVYTSAGRLPFQGIIHVVGINMLWRASAALIENSVRNAMALAEQHTLRTLAFPVIGAGSGGFNTRKRRARHAGHVCTTAKRGSGNTGTVQQDHALKHTAIRRGRHKPPLRGAKTTKPRAV